MTNPLDAAARLAEGRPVVDDLAEYVLACHRLGYEDPNLTAHTSQVRDWYDGEADLDLRALDADCAALAAAAGAAEDAARTHADLVAELSDVWAGHGASAAGEFARRSGQAATSVSSALRTAADALATLRDELWRAVDAKVTVVQEIDGRHRAERGEWLAAARTVTTGAGDLAAASELVDQHVKPFVQNDVGSNFIGAMRTASASIGTAYDAAVASASSSASAVFEVPGDLGPRAMATERPRSDDGAGVAATTVPAAAGMPSTPAVFSPATAPVSGPAWPAPPPPASSPPVADPAASAPLVPTAPASSSMPSTPSMGDLGGAAPGLGGGMSGFGQQLADLIGSLVGSSGVTDDLAGIDGAVDDPEDPPLDEDLDDEDLDDEDVEDEDPDEPPPDDEDPAEETEIEEPTEEVVEEAPAEPAPEPTPVPPPVPDGEPVVPPAVPEAVAEIAEQTPCEIAADELPQVGE